jgi:ABC-type nitrate/sulfonate/bicarbonate transport system substrate-binding protein
MRRKPLQSLFSRIFLLALGLSLFAGAWLFGIKVESAEPAEQGPFVIKYPNIQWFDPVYVADEKGWFAEEGIQIQWAGEIPAAQLAPAVASRSIDFANRHTLVVLMAIAGGARLKLVAAGAKTTPERPHMKCVVLPTSSIQSVKDFKGKKIAVNSFGAGSEYVLKEYLKRNGLDKDVEFVVIPDAKQEQVLRQGLIDVGVLHSPYCEKVVKTGAGREVFNDYVVDDGISGMLPYFTHTDFIQEHPDIVRKFLRVLVRASEWTNEHHEEAGVIFAKRRGLDPGYAESWDYYKNGIIPDDVPVQWWIDLLVREGKLKEGRIIAWNVYTNDYNPYYRPGQK